MVSSEQPDEATGEEIAGLINTFGSEFWEMVQARHELGEKKYGPGKFLKVDTMEEALFELADLANYACYTFVKIRLLQERIGREAMPEFAKTLDPNG
jgi:hypothetical protein